MASISHAGQAFFGTHGPVVPEAGDLQAKRIKYWGVVGERELRGGLGGRIVTTSIVIHNKFAQWSTLRTYLLKIDRHIGKHGMLVVPGTVEQAFLHCTFLGFDRGGDPEGRDGPLPDEAGTLDGGWWIRGTLRWRQLTV